jgi:hypothetical protein
MKRALLLLLVAAVPASAAVDFPKIVVLDERSPHLGLVAQVRDANLAELAPLSTNPQALRLRSLVDDVISGRATLPPEITRTSVPPEVAASDPVVASVAAHLDLEAGIYTVGAPGALVAIGRIGAPVVPQVPYVLPREVADGTCTMPTVQVFPAVTTTSGQPLKKSESYLKLDTSTCQFYASSKKEARRARMRTSINADGGARAARNGLISTPTSLNLSQPLGVFYGCAPHIIQCGQGNTNHYAKLYSRVYTPWGSIATNVLAQSYWKWDGTKSVCVNVGPTMYDAEYLDGPGDDDVRWEPRDCEDNRGEYCFGYQCPLQWTASTKAPNSTFRFWHDAIGFHRFHYFIPTIPGNPVPAGVKYDLYHWTRAEFLAEPTHGLFTGLSCQWGGNYGRGYPWYTYTGCFAANG